MMNLKKIVFGIILVSIISVGLVIYASSVKISDRVLEVIKYSQEAYEYAKKVSISSNFTKARLDAKRAMEAALKAKRAGEAIKSALDEQEASE
ncbi:MAG: hypothetical protein ABIA97_04445 [Candidatus Omnitrophota bacterium]